MPTTWIDITDTAIKIGLGALISGIATYKVAQTNHKNDITKTLTNKKVEILEELSELAEEYFYFCTALNNKVGGMQKVADNTGKPLTENQSKAIAKAHENFTETLSKRNKAISKIKILGIVDAEEAIRNYNDVMSEFRDDVVFNRVLITVERREELATRYAEHKDAFYSAINKYMEELGA